MWRRRCVVMMITRSTRGRMSTTTSTLHEPLNWDEMPTPKRVPLFGTTLALLAAGSVPRLHQYIDARHARLGPVFREPVGGAEAVFVADPNEMRAVFNRDGKYPRHVLPDAWILYNRIYGCSRGLFFMDGEEWLQFRRIMNKLLLKSDSIQWLHEPCEQVVSAICKRWESLLDKNGQQHYATITNLEQQLYRFSIDTLMAVLLGDKYSECKSELEDDVAYLSSVVHLIFQASAKLYIIPATWAATLQLPSWKRFVHAANDGLNIAYKLTKRIMDECPKGNGLVAKMMRENISEKDITRIIADLILAAGDTTAYSMEWTIYLLAKHVDVQEKLIDYKSDPVKQSNLIKGIIREALRLYPVAPFLSRILPQDMSIGGYLVPSGTLVVMSLYSSSRNPKYFPMAEKFWPERWFYKNASGSREFIAASANASMPFAMGTRSCIGRKIAEIHMHAALKKISETFHLELMTTKKVDVVFRMVSVPSVPISIRISARE